MRTNYLNRIKALGAGFVLWTVLASDAAFAATAADGHESGSAGLPQLDTSTYPSQLFWLAVMFAVMYLIFSKRSLPEISGVLENRQNHIRSDLETANRLRSEASAAQAAYETGLQTARNSATQALADVNNETKDKAEKQADKFRKKSEETVAELEKSLLKAKENAMGEMNAIAASIAREAASKIVGIQADQQEVLTVVESLNRKAA